MHGSSPPAKRSHFHVRGEPSSEPRLGQNYRIARAEGQRGPWKAKVTACHYTPEESDGRENDPDPIACVIDQRAA